MLIEKCPHCGAIAIRYNKIICGGHGYWIECMDCHWCGKTKLFLRSAWKAWNKESKDISRCIGCKNKHGDNCPNSSLCYSLPYKPFYEKEAQRNDE